MLSLHAKLASRHLDINLELAEHERMAILGPNGAGKSSVLAVLAGLLRPDTGRAELDGRVLFDLGRTPRRRAHWLAPHARGVVLMAQDPLLFPHLSVGENVAFGPRSAGAGAAAARATARHWLEQVGAADLVERTPGQLSGGQAQRVAIARALACDPRLLLLDEPMAALDVAAVPEMRELLRRVLAGRASLLVTHDLLDALILADRVVVLEAGRVVESGATADVLRHPKTAFSARLAGLNLVIGRAHARGVQQQDGQVVEGLARVPLTIGRPAVAAFSPSAVSVFATPPHGSPRNTIEVVITELEPREDRMRVRAVTGSGQGLAADVTTPAVAELGLHPGARLYFSLKASAVTLYPA